MPRPKYVAQMTRKNVFLPDDMILQMEKVTREFDLTEADIFRGAVNIWLQKFLRAGPRIQLEEVDKAKAISK